MNFDLSPADLDLQRIARTFGEERIKPLAARMDRDETLDVQLVKEAGKLGLCGITAPKEYGGLGLGNFQLSLAMEELNRCDASTGITISVHNSLTQGPIVKYGTPAQKEMLLPKMTRGEWIGCYSLTEPQSGSDAAGLICKAEKHGDKYLINGVKSWVTSAAFADIVLLMARTGEHKTHGITSFIIPMKSPGVSISKSEIKCGLRASKTNEITFTNVEVPASAVLGVEGQGFKIALDTLDGGRIGVGAQAVGIAQAALDAAVQFVKANSGTYKELAQVWNAKLADMKTRVDASRLLVWRAAQLRDLGKSCTLEAAAAKLFASQTANYCADEAVSIFGAAGYTSAHPVERFFRDARITEIYEGTTEIQKLVIARNLLT